VALVRYYKFNGDLLDSSGYGFDLGTHSGSPVFQTGVLGQGVTGTPSPYTPYWGAIAQGARQNCVLAANATQANSSNTSFSITFWLRINDFNYSSSILSLEGVIGIPVTIDYYSGNPVQLYFNYAQGIASVEAPFGEWCFVHYYLDTDGYHYMSVNNGTPVQNGYAPTVAYDTLKVGSTNAYTPFDAQLDELRIYNSLLTPAEVDQIYNLGNPSELATSSVTNYAVPLRQNKLNGNLTASAGGINATATFINYKGSGLFAASSNAIALEADGDSVETSNASYGGNATSSGSFSISFWQEVTGTSGATVFPQFTCGPITRSINTDDGTDPYVTQFDGNQIANYIYPVNDPIGRTSLYGMYVYNDDYERFVAYSIDANNEVYVVGQIASGRPVNDITGWLFDNGTNATPCTTYVDEVRFYEVALTGLDAVQLYNNGTGTEAYGLSATAIGSLPSRAVESATGNASGESSATGASNTVNISSLDGIAAGGATPLVSFLPILMPPPSAEGTGDGITSTNANGLFETVAVEQLLGSADGQQNVSLSISFVTINVRPQLNQPVHNYKLDSSLGDSYSTNTLTQGPIPQFQITGGISFSEINYIASGLFVPSLGTYALRGLADGFVNLPLALGFATGPTAWDNTAYTQRSYTFSIWIRYPISLLGNTIGGLYYNSSMTILFNSVRMYFSLQQNSVTPTYYIDWNPTQPGGGLPVELASGTIQPGPVVVPASNQSGGDFFLTVSYNHILQQARVITGQNGSLTSASIVSVSPSDSNYGAPGGAIGLVGSGGIGARIGVYIDDIRVYNYALNEYEIENIYNNGAGDIIPAQGFGIGAFSPVVIYSISGSAFTTYGGPLETVNLVTLDGSASGTISSTTSGTLATITVTPFAANAQGNPFGPFATLSVVPFAGSALYIPSSGFPVVLIRPLAGRATGSSIKSASFVTLPISSLSGSGAGSATNSSNLATVTIISLAGSSTGSGLASALFAGLTIVSSAGAASGSGNSSGASNTITITALSGSAASNALASSAVSIITILPLAGSASGQGSATSASNIVTISTFSGSVIATANTSGQLATISIAAIGATISGANANATGTLSGGPAGTGIRLDAILPPLAGGAFGGTAKLTGGQFVTVAIGTLSGTAQGNVVNGAASGSLASIGIVAPLATSIGSSLGSGNFGLQPPVIQLSLGSAGLSVSASTSGTLQTVSVQSLSGTSQGSSIIAGSLSAVAVSSLQGSSIGSAVISAVSQTVSILPPSGSASVLINASGSLTTITIGVISCSTAAGVVAQSQGATIIILPTLGVTNGTNIVGGGRASVTTYHSI